MSLGSLKRWLYRGDRPHVIAQFLNRLDVLFVSLSLSHPAMATLEVIGRKSGQIVSLPVAVAVVDGQRYLVSMLGANAQWVLNMRAANGQAALVSRKREAVQLDEIPVEQRAPIIKAYLKIAFGARPHIPVSPDAPLTEFEKIAADFPVFRVTPRKV